MSSSHAQRFNTAARPRIAAVHGEDVTHNYVYDDSDETQTLNGVWKRVKPTGETETDGIGVTSYSGEATFVCSTADLPDDYDDIGDLVRNGETWAINYIEPIDQWQSRLHLAKPHERDFRPGRVAR